MSECNERGVKGTIKGEILEIGGTHGLVWVVAQNIKSQKGAPKFWGMPKKRFFILILTA